MFTPNFVEIYINLPFSTEIISLKVLDFKCCKIKALEVLENKVVHEKSWKMFCLVWKILLHNWTAHKFHYPIVYFGFFLDFEN